MADLKKVTRRIRAAGLELGLHIHYSKAVKTDSYVTPVPDDRFHKVRTFTLAAAAGREGDDHRGERGPGRLHAQGDRRHPEDRQGADRLRELHDDARRTSSPAASAAT